VRDVLERFRPQLDAAGCFLYTTFLSHPAVVEIDIYRTEQVLVNLLTNAMKYGAGRPIRVELRVENQKLQLLVHDKGPGILEEDVDRIFQRFERAVSCNEVSGLGLGLYISRKIMQQNNGSLFVRSSPGAGSTFIMEFPCQS
jgi:signal transduction histidine kinase